MIVGIVREIKDFEHRVGLIPSFVSQLAQSNHEVVVETLAGEKSGFSDEQYLEAGAKIVLDAADVYSCADIIIKIKEPQLSEHNLLRRDQIILSFCHLATQKELVEALLRSGTTCIAYETVTGENGTLPLLEPVSIIAGRMSMIIASNLLTSNNGGSGMLISGVPGVKPANVTIIGGGVVGSNSIMMANGMFANITLIDNNISVLKRIENNYKGRVNTVYSNRNNIMESIKHSDIIIASVLEYAVETPKLISRDMIKAMKKGSVLVDVSIDQGGCSETSHPTTYMDPIYEVDGVIHYCVSNIASIVANTASVSLSNSIFPYLKKITELGLKRAVLSDGGLRNGINVMDGYITHECIAKAHNVPYTDPCQLLK